MAITADRYIAAATAVQTSNWSFTGAATFEGAVLPDGLNPDTRYCSSSTVNALLSFELSATDLALIPNDATITAMKLYARSSYVLGGGNGTYTWKMGGTTYNPLNGTLSATLVQINLAHSSVTINPNTGLAWTKTDLATTEFGFKNLSSSTQTVYQFFIVVTYSSPSITVSPTSGPTTGGTTVTVTGAPSTFNTGNISIAIGTNITVISDSSLTFDTTAQAAGLTNFSILIIPGWSGTYNYASVGIQLTGSDGFTFVAPSWWTLTTLPATIVRDAQTLTDAEFAATWDALIGSAYANWVYLWLRGSRITLPQAISIHWYYYAVTAPGTSWTVTSVPSDHGWFQSTDKFASSANLVIGDIPNNPRDWTEIASFATGNAGMLGGFPGTGVNFRNHFIYADGGYTVGTDSPTLRIFDGLSDRTIATLPNTSAGVIPKAIMSMVLVGETIYLSTLDSGSNDTDFAGRVFSFEPLTGTMTQIGADFTGGEVPYALCWHMNRIWCGTNQGSGVTGKIYFFRPGIDAAWTTDYTLSTSSVGGCCSLASYKGQLFVGTDNAAGSFAKVLVRDSLGAYTTSLTATGGTAKVNNGFLSMIVFNDNLYATYWNEDTTAVAKIYKYDNTSWTTAYTGAAGTLRPFVSLYVTDGTMIVVGGGRTLTSVVLTTANGTSYTDRTTSLLGGTSTASPVIGEVVI